MLSITKPVDGQALTDALRAAMPGVNGISIGLDGSLTVHRAISQAERKAKSAEVAAYYESYDSWIQDCAKIDSDYAAVYTEWSQSATGLFDSAGNPLRGPEPVKPDYPAAPTYPDPLTEDLDYDDAAVQAIIDKLDISGLALTRDEQLRSIAQAIATDPALAPATKNALARMTELLSGGQLT